MWGSILRLIVSFAAGFPNANDEGARGRHKDINVVMAVP